MNLGCLNRTKPPYQSRPVEIRYVADEAQRLKAVEDGHADFSLLLTASALPMLQQSPNTVVAFAAGQF